MQKITHIFNHEWEIKDEEASSKLFDTLLLSEFGEPVDPAICKKGDIYLNGFVKVKIKINQIEVYPDNKIIIVSSTQNEQYELDLDESIAQFVKKYWDKN